VVQNTVGTDVYGTYFPLLNLVLIFQIFLDLGIDNFTRKEVAHNPGLTNRFLSQFLLLKFILMGIFILIFSTIGYFIPHSQAGMELIGCSCNKSIPCESYTLPASQYGWLAFIQGREYHFSA
jgi:O-antigen/teichoic acid export membrane protein